MSSVFITRNNEQLGPYSTEQIANLLKRGEISMGDFAWQEGCAEWTRLHDLPELVAAVIPPLPHRSLPPIIPSEMNPQSNEAPPTSAKDRETRRWWNRELWPDPTLAELERRKTFWTKVLVIGLVVSLLLLGVGWLVEGKKKDEIVVSGLPQRTTYNPFSLVLRMFSDGPIGFLGAMVLAGTLATGVVIRSVDTQLEKTRKKESPSMSK